MNFFSTRHYGNTESACQRISAGNSLFPEKNGRETVCRRDFGPRAEEMAELAPGSGRAHGRGDSRGTAPGMLDKQSHPRHPRLAIHIGEINLAADKDLPTIRASRRQDEDRQDDDFKDREKRTWHSASSNRNSKSLLRQSGYGGWTENGSAGPTRIRTWDQGIMSPLL